MTILKLAHMDEAPDLYPITPSNLFPDDRRSEAQKEKESAK